MFLRIFSFLACLCTAAAAGWGFILANKRWQTENLTVAGNSTLNDLAAGLTSLNRSIALFQGLMSVYYVCVAGCGAKRDGGRDVLAVAPRVSPALNGVLNAPRPPPPPPDLGSCRLFSFLGMFAELRTRYLRGTVLRHLTFLTTYFGRACFLIYIGELRASVAAGSGGSSSTARRTPCCTCSGAPRSCRRRRIVFRLPRRKSTPPSSCGSQAPSSCSSRGTTSATGSPRCAPTSAYILEVTRCAWRPAASCR